MTIPDYVQQSFSIMQKAYDEYQPSYIICLFSGGYDSMVATTLAWNWFKSILPVKVVSIDTLVSADGWRDYVTQVAIDMGWDFEIWDNPNPDWYGQSVLDHGFPYTRGIHRLYFQMLKERAIRAVKKNYKQHRRDRIMFVSGQRRAESPERANVDEFHVMDAQGWLAPIVYWSDEQLLQFRNFAELPTNPFYETVGGSGDCLCNWGNFTTLETLQKYSPQLASRIAPLDEECRARHGWGWDESPSKGLLAERAGQMVLPGIEPLTTPDLCAGCQRVRPGKTQAEDDYLANRIEW